MPARGFTSFDRGHLLCAVVKFRNCWHLLAVGRRRMRMWSSMWAAASTLSCFASVCGVWPSQRILSATLNRATTDGPHHSRHINIKLALHTFLFRFCVLCVLITVTHQRCTTGCGIAYQRVNKRTTPVKVSNYFVRKCYSKLNSFVVLPNGMIK